MQTVHVNGTDMAYLEVGKGRPLVCVHGSLGDFRTWLPLIGPLSKKHRKGLLPLVLHTLAAHVPDARKAIIPDTSHRMFEQAPQRFCAIVLEFLAA